jgi:hypothetical protein
MEFFADPVVASEHELQHHARHPVEVFLLTVEDSLHGEVDYLRCRLSTVVDQAYPALGLEMLFDRLPLTEVKTGGADGAAPFGPKSPTWRTLTRIAAINTNVSRKLLVRSKDQAEEITARLLGPCLPHKLTINRPFDGFRSVAVALSLHLNRLVTPRRAAACFARMGHQTFNLTEYGISLLKRCRKAWPPCLPPENASSMDQQVRPLPARVLAGQTNTSTTPSLQSQLSGVSISESQSQQTEPIVDVSINLSAPPPDETPQRAVVFSGASPFVHSNPIREEPLARDGGHPGARKNPQRNCSQSILYFLEDLQNSVPVVEFDSTIFSKPHHAFQTTAFPNEVLLT